MSKPESYIGCSALEEEEGGEGEEEEEEEEEEEGGGGGGRGGGGLSVATIMDDYVTFIEKYIFSGLLSLCMSTFVLL